MVKLATWNLGYAFGNFRRTHAEAWKYLREQIRPDVALLQEVNPPKLPPGETILFSPIFRDWGTAIYAMGFPLRKLPLRRYPRGVVPGRVIIAALALETRELALASIHAPVIRNEVHPHLDRIFDQLEALLQKRSAIIGGDLNSARACEEAWPDSGHGAFFERIGRGPFIDCHWQFHGKEIQTFFRENTQLCLQDDHIFASPDIAKRFISCTVLDNETTRRLSDHIPIVANIDI
jgi:endonuclease/exonuclease/phosphatase family metal-dependent hydrolase